jgi:hypothetical protein
MEKISWSERVKNAELHRVDKERNILNTVERRKANWIGHILSRNCLLKHVTGGEIEERIEETRRRRQRRKQLFGFIKETTGYWKREEEAVDRTLKNSIWKRREKAYRIKVINIYNAKYVP